MQVGEEKEFKEESKQKDNRHPYFDQKKKKALK